MIEHYLTVRSTNRSESSIRATLRKSRYPGCWGDPWLERDDHKVAFGEFLSMLGKPKRGPNEMPLRLRVSMPQGSLQSAPYPEWPWEGHESHCKSSSWRGLSPLN
jgi:hypothetical protein